jgi:type II secretory pathway pseudopilin PulG
MRPERASVFPTAVCAPRPADGFGLVELMVAVALAAVIVLALADVLIEAKSSYTREDELARLQETGRLALLGVAARLRETRSLDCFSLAEAENAAGRLRVKACALSAPDGSGCDAPGPSLSEGHLLRTGAALGYDGTAADSPGAMADLPAEAQADLAERRLRGDVFVVWGITGAGVAVTNPLAALSPGTIDIAEPAPGLSQGRLALISNCESSELFEISAPTASDQRSATPYLEHQRDDPAGQRVNLSSVFQAAYNIEPGDARRQRVPRYRARLFPFRYRVYYICCVDRDSGRLQVGASALARCLDRAHRYRPALCEWRIGGGRSQALIGGIADLRVTYTGDRDGDHQPDYFAGDSDPVPGAHWVSAQGLWAGVLGARVELLTVSDADGLRSSPRVPARAHWPPNGGGAGGIHPDTLGAGMAADRRLYQRFVLDTALRTAAPWGAW